MGYRKLAVAVLDEDRRILRASSEFNIPVSALPEKAIPSNGFRTAWTTRWSASCGARFGVLSRQWTAPDGRWYQVLLARLPLASGANDRASVLARLVRPLAAEGIARALRKGLIETLVASVLAAAALGIWAAARGAQRRVRRIRRHRGRHQRRER